MDDALASYKDLKSDIDAVCGIIGSACMAAAFRSSDLQYPEADIGSKKNRDARCRTEDRVYGLWNSLSESWEVPGTLPDSVLQLLRDTYALCDTPKQTEPWTEESADHSTLDDSFSKLAVDNGATTLTCLLNQKARAKPKTRPLVPVAQGK